MKNVFRIMLIAAAASLFALPAYAQGAAAQTTTPASAQDAEAKAELYKRFLSLINGGAEQQRQASAVGKEYMSKYPTPVDDADKQIFDYVKNWVARYDKAVRDFDFNKALADSNYTRAFEIGRQMLTEQPENVEVALTLARAALANASARTPNEGLYPESLRFTRTAIQLIESGKAPAKWEAPLNNREEALGWLHFAHGLLTVKSSPAEAAEALVKAAQASGATKTQPATYFHLGNAYVAGDYAKAVNAYRAVFPEGKEITEDLKPQYDQLIGQVNTALDRIIDAYARAVALSTKPDQQQFKSSLTAQLTKYHQARYENSTAADVQTYINGVLSRPLPLPGQPVAAPAPAAASTAPAASTTTAAPAATNGAARPAAPAPAATPKPRQ